MNTWRENVSGFGLEEGVNNARASRAFRARPFSRYNAARRMGLVLAWISWGLLAAERFAFPPVTPVYALALSGAVAAIGILLVVCSRIQRGPPVRQRRREVEPLGKNGVLISHASVGIFGGAARAFFELAPEAPKAKR